MNNVVILFTYLKIKHGKEIVGTFSSLTKVCLFLSNYNQITFVFFIKNKYLIVTYAKK